MYSCLFSRRSSLARSSSSSAICLFCIRSDLAASNRRSFFSLRLRSSSLSKNCLLISFTSSILSCISETSSLSAIGTVSSASSTTCLALPNTSSSLGKSLNSAILALVQCTHYVCVGIIVFFTTLVLLLLVKELNHPVAHLVRGV